VVAVESALGISQEAFVLAGRMTRRYLNRLADGGANPEDNLKIALL